MPNNPYQEFRFRVEISGIALAGFSEVTIGEATIDVVEYREGTDPTHIRKLSGLTRYANITLRRGMTATLDLFHWFHAVSTLGADANRRSVTIFVQDDAGVDVLELKVERAWPARYHIGELDARRSAVLIEAVELAHEGYAWA